MAQVFVLGHRGMLGHVVARHLEECGHTVLTTGETYDGAPGATLIDAVVRSPAQAVINCIGVTPAHPNARAMLAINGLLPQHLAVMLDGRLLVHASSDGVFSGAAGPYAADAVPDGGGPYELSKRLGELHPPGASMLVLRCSIVGPDPRSDRGLLAWVLAQRGEIVGHTDKLWNGITTLEWARLAERAVRDDPALRPGLHQPACAEAVSKADLVGLIAGVWQHDVRVRRAASGTPIDRRLVPTLALAPIDSQLRDLRRWYESKR